MRTISSVYFWSWSLFLLFCFVTGKTIRSSSSSPISDLLLNSTRQALDIFDQIFSKIKDSDDILHFHGHKTFERLRNAAAVEIGGVVKYKRWSEIAKDLIKHYSLHHHNHSHTHANQSAAKFNHISSISTDKSNHSNSPTSALRLHNDLKLGDFLQLITHPHLHKKFRMQENVSINCTLESLITKERFNSYFDLGQPPIVLTNVIDENWGFLSTVIMNRTTRWINMTNHLRIHDHSYRTLSYFLNSPKVCYLLSE